MEGPSTRRGGVGGVEGPSSGILGVEAREYLVNTRHPPSPPGGLGWWVLTKYSPVMAKV